MIVDKKLERENYCNARSGDTETQKGVSLTVTQWVEIQKRKEFSLMNRKKGKIVLGFITYLAMLHPIGELHLFLNNCVSGCLRTTVYNA